VTADVDLRMELPEDRDITVVQLRGRRGRGEGRDGQTPTETDRLVPGPCFHVERSGELGEIQVR
jgi:hypothetical protein